MLLKFRSPFKGEDQIKDDHDDHKERVVRSSFVSNKPNYGRGHERKAKRSSVAHVGLRIVVPISSPQDQDQYSNSNNVVVKSALRLSQPRTKNTSAALEYPCFLKTCNLCNKGLSFDKEVYMYRGNQGFCSIECRDRQIFIDEMKELEASTKQMISSYRDSCNTRGHETGFLSEELSHRNRHNINKPSIPNYHRHHRRNYRAVFIS